MEFVFCVSEVLVETASSKQTENESY